MRINLSVAVENIVFDTDLGELRVSGKVVNENPHVKKGSYHTLELGAAGASRSAAHIFTLYKSSWDAESLRRLREASKPGANSDIIGIAISSTQAVVCLVSEHMTIVRASFEPHIPRARGDGSGQKKAVEALYGTIYEALLSTAEGRFADLKLVIVAGPGFMKSAFFDFAMAKVRQAPVAARVRASENGAASREWGSVPWTPRGLRACACRRSGAYPPPRLSHPVPALSAPAGCSRRQQGHPFDQGQVCGGRRHGRAQALARGGHARSSETARRAGSIVLAWSAVQSSLDDGPAARPQPSWPAPARRHHPLPDPIGTSCWPRPAAKCAAIARLRPPWLRRSLHQCWRTPKLPERSRPWLTSGT